MKNGKLWSENETILAINLYFQIPFGKIHKGNPQIIDLANILGRTPSSVGLKLANFAHLDPYLDRAGMKNCARMMNTVWQKYYDNFEKLSIDSNTILTLYQQSTESENRQNIEILSTKETESEYITKQRICQNYFRAVILASYHNTCCITGINIPKLLIASHIKPWSQDEQNRLNPRNGLCLNSLHDKAFDSGLITIDNQHKIVVAKDIKEHYRTEVIKEYFAKYEGNKILRPERFYPDSNFLQFHRENIFLG